MKKGFTLIELLIVIALLGALAIGLLATIDPFEQLKKGRDTSTRNTDTELYNASIRYYSINSEFPWGSSLDSTLLEDMSSHVAAMESAGELKQNFLGLAKSSANKIYVTSTGAEHIAVCFQPESKSFQKDQNTKFKSDGTEGEDCKSASDPGDTNCYWCMQ